MVPEIVTQTTPATNQAQPEPPSSRSRPAVRRLLRVRLLFKAHSGAAHLVMISYIMQFGSRQVTAVVWPRALSVMAGPQPVASPAINGAAASHAA